MVDAFNEYYLRGKILYLEGKYTDCINPYEQALRIASSNPVLGDKLPKIYNALGSAYNYTGSYEKAKLIFQSALAIAKDTGYKSGECSCYLNLSMVYCNLNSYPESLTCLDKAESIALEIGNKQRLAESYLQYGFIYDDTVIIFVISSDIFEAKKIDLPKPLEQYFLSFHKKWSRGIRKGHFHEWYKELSPEEDTLKKWLYSKKTEEDWKKYLSKFLPQMKGSEAVGKIEELRERSKKGEIITLLCHCRPGEHCHRYIIKSKIKGSSKVIESD